jgi:ABC-type transport system involved in multi-copper enzyme maturation permease subunit
MSRLLRVELGRFWSRRLFRVLAVLAMLALVTAGVIALLVSENAEDPVARIEAERQAQIDDCVRSFEGATDLPPEIADDPEGYCAETVFVQDPRFPYNDMTGILQGLGIPLLMIGWLVGASFVGAEWHNRTMTTMLTWESRRARLFVAKLIALTIGVTLMLALIQLFALLAFLPAGLFVGNMSGIDGAWWTDLFSQVARTCGVGVVAAVFGISLAMIGRNTAAALGVGFVYLAVVESLIRGFKPEWTEWLLGDNLALVLIAEAENIFGMGHSVGAGVLLLIAYAGGLFLLALAFFKRRDLA